MINATNSVKDKFFLWLSKKVSSAQLSEYAISCVDIEKFCLQEKILDKPLFEVTDFNIIGGLIDIIRSNNMYKKFRSGYGHNFSKVSTALKYYRDFLKINFGTPPAKIETPAEKIDSTKKAFKEWLKVTYMSDTAALRYLNLADTINKMLKDRKIIATDLFLITDLEKLREIKTQLFSKVSFTSLNLLTTFDYLIKFFRYTSTAEKVSASLVKSEVGTDKINKSAEILYNRSNTISLQQNSAAKKISVPPAKSEVGTDKINKSAEILHNRSNAISPQQNSNAEKISAPPVKAEVSTDKINKSAEILHNRSNAISLQQNSNAEKISVPPVKSEISLSEADKYAEILSKYFGEDGYKLGKIIPRKKFKNYFFDEYGENPADSAEQIEEILKKIGAQRDNRIFPKQNENQNKLLEVIVNDIVAAFNSGASAVFVEAVYEKYKKPLAEELKIYNAESCAPAIFYSKNQKSRSNQRYYQLYAGFSSTFVV